MADSKEGSRASRSRVAHAPKSARRMRPSSDTSIFAAFKSLHNMSSPLRASQAGDVVPGYTFLSVFALFESLHIVYHC